MNLAKLFENSTLDPKTAVFPTGKDFPGVHLLPSGEELEFVDRLLYKQRNPDLVLKKILEKLDKDFDFALLDCPPNRGTLTSNAIAACHGYITPLDMDINAIDGVLAMHKLVNELYEEGIITKKPINLGAFWTRFTKKDSYANRDITKIAEDVLRNILLDIKIPESSHVKEAIFSTTTLQFDKKHKVSQAYLALTNHITSKLNQIKGLTL
jgi:chromosome partitioning protein